VPIAHRADHHRDAIGAFLSASLELDLVDVLLVDEDRCRCEYLFGRSPGST